MLWLSTIDRSIIYAKWLEEKRKFDTQIEDKNNRIWELEERLQLSQKPDVLKQLEDERENKAKLESRLREREVKVREIESELNELRHYKNEAFNLKLQLVDLQKQLDQNAEAQIVETELPLKAEDQTSTRDLEADIERLTNRIRELEDQIEKLNDDIRFCYDISGGNPKDFQREFRETFPESFQSELDQ